jgi:hypothetical protein
LEETVTENERRVMRCAEAVLEDSPFKVSSRESLGQVLLELRDTRSGDDWAQSLVFSPRADCALVRDRVRRAAILRLEARGWVPDSGPISEDCGKSSSGS